MEVTEADMAMDPATEVTVPAMAVMDPAMAATEATADMVDTVVATEVATVADSVVAMVFQFSYFHLIAN